MKYEISYNNVKNIQTNEQAQARPRGPFPTYHTPKSQVQVR